MADALYYWDGTQWRPIASGGGGGGASGPAGPPGPAGHSVEVYGPQASIPATPAKGDMWLYTSTRAVTKTACGNRLKYAPLPPVAATPCGKRPAYPTLSGGLTYKPGKYRVLKKRK
jgi:hypothetical protein